MTFPRAVLWLAWTSQVVGGVLGFAFGAEQVFLNIGGHPLAHQTLRLAVYSNASAALLTLGVLLWAPSHRWLRLLAISGVVYHVPAGVDGLRAASNGLLVEPIYGPAVFHGVMAALLLAAALWPEPSESVEHDG